MGASASVQPFVQREGIRGEDRYAATTFRRVELQEEDLNILFAIFTKIKQKNPYPKVVNPQSICKYFGVNNSDFVLKLFDAVDFDGNDSIDFKEFILGLWNFLSLSSDFLAALVFYIYDPLKFNLLDMKELKELLEAVHGVQLSSFTPTLNNILKNALIDNQENGINTEAFGIMCIDSPFIIKPIVTLQKQLRKKIVGPAYWKKLEFRRSASIRGNLRDVNYVYIVNEETEVWRKKDFELGIAKDYILDETELTLKKRKEQIKEAKEAEDRAREEEKKAQEEQEEEEARLRDEAEDARQAQELQDKLEANKDIQISDEDYVAKNRVKMNEDEGRDVDFKKGVQRNYADFAETLFMTSEGSFVPPTVPIEAVTLFEFPGEEKFVFGLVTDNKKKDEKLIMVNRDLTRRRMKGADLARINTNFKFVGYSKLTLKTLPDQIKLRNNIPLLVLCNNISEIPTLIHESDYKPAQWNDSMRAIITRTSNTGDTNYLEVVDKLRKSKEVEEEEKPVETQGDRVNTRVTLMLNKQKEGRKSINGGSPANAQRPSSASGRGQVAKRNTIHSHGGSQGAAAQKRNTINRASSSGGKSKSRSTINAGSSSSNSLGDLRPAAAGKLAPLKTSMRDVKTN